MNCISPKKNSGLKLGCDNIYLRVKQEMLPLAHTHDGKLCKYQYLHNMQIIHVEGLKCKSEKFSTYKRTRLKHYKQLEFRATTRPLF